MTRDTWYNKTYYPESRYFRYSLFYSAMTDNKCAGMTPKSGLEYDYYKGYYIPPGGTATWTCTTTVTADTTNTLTSTFRDYYGYSATARPTATVNVQRISGAASCSTLWYGADSNSDGTVDGHLGTVTTTGSPGPLPIHTIADVPGGQASNGGTAAIAVDPKNPQRIYYIPREYSNAGIYGGLRVFDSVAGTDIEVTKDANTPDVVRLGFDGNGTLWTIDSNGRLWSWVVGATTWTDRGLVSLTVPNTALTASDLQSGDLAFDGLGTMWFIASVAASNRAYLFTISAAQLGGASGAAATYVGDMGVGWFHGLAFDETGQLYATSGSTTYLHKVDKVTGTTAQVGTKPIGSNIGDLSSCALPKPELRVNKTGAAVEPPAPAGTVLPGGTLRFTIEIANLGNLEATGVTFQDLVPGTASYVAGSTKLNGVTVPDVNGAMPYLTAQLIKSATATYMGTVAAGDKAVITFDVKVAPNATRICNSGQANFTGATSTILTDDPSLPGFDDPTCLAVLTPAVGLDKKSDTTVVGPNDELTGTKPVTYTYWVATDPNQPHGYPEVPVTGKAIGTEALSNVVVTDDKCSPIVPRTVELAGVEYNVGDRNQDNLLQPDESWGYDCTTSLPLEAETLNTAKVTANGSVSGTAVTDQDTWLVKPLTFKVEKLALAGLDAQGGSQWEPIGAAVELNSDQTAQVQYRIAITNTGLAPGAHPEVVDSFIPPAGFTVTAATLGGASITITDGKFTIPTGTVELQPEQVANYLLTVTLKADDLAAVDWDSIGQCDVSASGDPTKGVFNQVSMASDLDGPDNNDACVPMVLPSQPIKILKQGLNCDIDQPTCPLAGATFALYDTDPTVVGGKPVEASVTVDGTGSVYTSQELAVPGTYWLVETRAPDGFSLLPDPIEFNLNWDGITIAGGANAIVMVDDTDAFKIVVSDTTPAPLPKAGGMGVLPSLAMGSLLIAVGLFYRRRMSTQSAASEVAG